MMPISDILSQRQPIHAQWRQHLHSIPELAFKEFRTAGFVAEKLQEFGLEYHRGLAGTGIVARLEGERPGPRIGLRADLDALPMNEECERPHASTHPGCMHACGHDGHVTMLLAAAEYLAVHRDFPGTVHFIFQPAEEHEGGGEKMVREGLFEKFPMDAVFGLHNWPQLQAGEFAVHPGPVMAAADRFDITFSGVGGHAAMPEHTTDVIIAAAQAVTALQTITSRDVAATDSAVVSVTKITGGTAHNVLPGRVELVGTARTFNDAARDCVEARMNSIIKGVANAFGVDGHLNYRRGYPPSVNHPQMAKYAERVARMTVGVENVNTTKAPSMGAEDFAYMLRAVPGCYVWLGSASRNHAVGLHHPHFDFNDAILPIGAQYWIRLVQNADTLNCSN